MAVYTKAGYATSDHASGGVYFGTLLGVQVTQEVVEVLFPLSNPGGSARATQVAVETLIGIVVPARVTQLAVEVLMPNSPIFVPTIYRRI